MTLATTETPIADPMLPRPYRVARKHRELADTFTLELAPGDGDALAAFAPGQFNMLDVFGVGEIPISFSSEATHTGTLVHTIRAVGVVSRAMCALRSGEWIGVRGPFGTAWPIEQAQGHDVIVVAGGIGLAPLRPVVQRLLAQRERYGQVTLLYGARTPEDILYGKDLQRWRERLALDTRITVDRATGAWQGAVGVVTRLIPSAPINPAHTLAMVCGPEVMMRFTAAALIQRGVAPEHIFVSMERNMACAIGHCGHCQYATTLVCRDGPVFPYTRLRDFLKITEL